MKTDMLSRLLGGGLIITALISIGFVIPNSLPTPESDVPVSVVVDNAVKAEMLRQNVLGVVVGIVQNGNVTYTKAYGYTDQLRTKPMSTNMIFRWASISKTVTAVAAFKAIEMNKLALSDKVTKHLSYWPTTDNKQNITLEHLLSHRSGILHYGRDQNEKYHDCYEKSNYSSPDAFNAQQCVNVFKKCPLAFTPGTQHLYSTFGANLVGAMVEVATQKPYVNFIQEQISNKANMTSFRANHESLGGYGTDCNLVINGTKEGNTMWKLPGGGWASTIGDLTKFMQGLCTGKFLNNTSAMWSKDFPNNNGYVYGFDKAIIGKDNLGRDKIHVGHGGAHDDVRTYMGFFPDDKTGVCLMTNHGDGVNPELFARAIEKALGYNWSTSNLPKEDCGGDETCGNTVMGIWQKTDKAGDIHIRRGYKSDAFHSEWEYLTTQGYAPVDIETWMDGGTRRWDGSFKKTNLRSAMIRNYSTDEFHNKWVELSNQGLRLVDVETYVDGIERKWAGVFLESSEPYALFRNFTTDDFNAKYNEMKDKNLRIIDVEPYYVGSILYWAGVWKGNGANNTLLNRNYDEVDFIALNTQRESQGFKLVNVEAYKVNGVRKWAGIWEKTNTPTHFIYNKKMCDFLNTYHAKYKKDGFELIDFENY